MAKDTQGETASTHREARRQVQAEKNAQQDAQSKAALGKQGYKQQLKRVLSVPDMIVYGLIFMVPIAPFGIYRCV